MKNKENNITPEFIYEPITPYEIAQKIVFGEATEQEKEYYMERWGDSIAVWKYKKGEVAEYDDDYLKAIRDDLVRLGSPEAVRAMDKKIKIERHRITEKEIYELMEGWINKKEEDSNQEEENNNKGLFEDSHYDNRFTKHILKRDIFEK